MSQFLVHVGVYLPVLLGTLCISAIQLGKRPLANSKNFSPLQLLVLWFSAATAIFAIVYLAVWGFRWPTVLPGYLVAIGGMTVAGVLIQYCNVRAASCAHGEVSLTAPIQAMTPGLITILGLALNEYPGWVGVLGIVLVACGSYVLMWDGTPQHWYEYLGPFRHLGRLTRYHSLTRDQQSRTLAVCWSLGAASLGTIGLLFGGLFTRRGRDFQGLTMGALIEVGVYAGVYMVWFLAYPDTPQKTRTIRGFKSAVEYPWRWLFLLMAVAWVSHMWLINPAFQHTYVAHVGTLKRFSVLVSVVLGLMLYREQKFEGPIWYVVYQPRFWAAVLTVLGVVCISLDDLPGRITTKFEGLGF